MRPTQALQSEIPLFKYGKYLNKDTWGNLGSQPQKGIISYSLSPNKQRINYSFSPSNAWRRFRTQVLYWAPPIIAAYYLMRYMDERSVPDKPIGPASSFWANPRVLLRMSLTENQESLSQFERGTETKTRAGVA